MPDDQVPNEIPKYGKALNAIDTLIAQCEALQDVAHKISFLDKHKKMASSNADFWKRRVVIITKEIKELKHLTEPLFAHYYKYGKRITDETAQHYASDFKSKQRSAYAEWLSGNQALATYHARGGKLIDRDVALYYAQIEALQEAEAFFSSAREKKVVTYLQIRGLRKLLESTTPEETAEEATRTDPIRNRKKPENEGPTP